jgi:hypothetical protein
MNLRIQCLNSRPIQDKLQVRHLVPSTACKFAVTIPFEPSALSESSDSILASATVEQLQAFSSLLEGDK